jgi:hypothetical protein
MVTPRSWNRSWSLWIEGIACRHGPHQVPQKSQDHLALVVGEQVLLALRIEQAELRRLRASGEQLGRLLRLVLLDDVALRRGLRERVRGDRTVDRELGDHELAAIGLAADGTLGLEAAGQAIGDADVPGVVHVLNEFRVRRRGGEHMAGNSANLLDAAQLARAGERLGCDQRRLHQVAHHVAGDELLARLVDRHDQQLLVGRQQDARGVAVVRVDHAVGELHAQIDA